MNDKIVRSALEALRSSEPDFAYVELVSKEKKDLEETIMGKTMYKVVLEWENVDNFNESEFHQNGTELGGVFSSFEGALTNVKTFIKERMSSSHIALQKYNHLTTDRKELEIFKWTECLTDFSVPYIDREITVYIAPFEVDEWTASRIY